MTNKGLIKTRKPIPTKPCGCRCGCRTRTDLAVKVWRRDRGFRSWWSWTRRTTQVCDRCMSKTLTDLPAPNDWGDL